MTSIHCPDCSTEVTSSERTCPRCNFPISKLRGLSAAILTKNAERVAGLIQLGADVNAPDQNGRTPLITAALMDDAEIGSNVVGRRRSP
ncbi:ankyrin repeat domain-containing protein [bacterium]|nr:ankyrin repeat domain-containing protein [bacterium]